MDICIYAFFSEQFLISTPVIILIMISMEGSTADFSLPVTQQTILCTDESIMFAYNEHSWLSHFSAMISINFRLMLANCVGINLINVSILIIVI
jgi:hypothetical protein